MIVILLILFVTLTKGNIATTSMLTDNMVLQRDIGARLFGASTCPTGSTVTVTMKDSSGAIVFTESVQTILDSKSGRNVFATQEIVRSGGLEQYTIDFTDCDHTRTRTGAVFGEVIHCAGQSNMEYTWHKIADSNGCALGAPSVCTAPVNTLEQYGTLRMLENSRDISTDGFTFNAEESGWVKKYTSYGNLNMADNGNRPSAYCTAIGIELDRLWNHQMPIGMVTGARGSSWISPWMSPDAIADCDPS